jgi:RHS repeat-associated protein
MYDASVVGYTGAFLDVVAGAYPLGDGYRMYLPWLMRFGAPDDDSPFGAGGVNCYTYCAGDPINGADPSGHAPLAAMEQLEGLLDELNSRTPYFDWSKHPIVGEHPIVGDFGKSLGTATHAGGETSQGVGEAVKMWADSLIAPLKINEIPTNDDGLMKLYRDAFDAGQIVLNPKNVSHGKVLWQWNPDIELNTVLLEQGDSRIVDLMKRYGLSRGRPYNRSHASYSATLTYDVHIDTGLEIALGGSAAGPNGYRYPFFLQPSKQLKRRPIRQYTDRFAAVANSKGFATESSSGQRPILASKYYLPPWNGGT